MPEFAPTPLISTSSELAALVAHLHESRRFAFDTEFVSEDTFEPILCLIQVATRDRMVAVDPLAIGDLSAFWEVVNDPAIEVVMHASGEDLRIDRFQSGTLPKRVVDVQISAGLLGYGYPMSLGNLVHEIVGATVHGGETRTDWRKRPLSEAQLRYAMDDVRYLLDAADRIEARLRDLGRLDWAESEYAQSIDAIRARDDEDRWRKLPGLHQLSRRALGIARSLSEWRREEARRSNRPVRQVLRDDLLVAIAKRQPGNHRDLEALRDFNRPHLLAKTHEFLGRIAEVQALPAGELPEPSERHDEGPGLTMVVSLLAATLNQAAAQSKVAASLVGSVADLKDLIRWNATGRPAAKIPRLLQGWRGGLCGEILLDVLAGRRALRIVDADSDVPVVVDPIS